MATLAVGPSGVMVRDAVRVSEGDGEAVKLGVALATWSEQISLKLRKGGCEPWLTVPTPHDQPSTPPGCTVVLPAPRPDVTQAPFSSLLYAQ